ncbi:Dipeptide transport system permease protein dppB [uncultured Clostridium sp.]|uniref:ABC transporter permease n=1 Tax=uncultured Clostridium sp. TaxID=59620 RepID=UPI0008202AC2|nr:ABC transporter permease [uncultured Clostridium sp.]SCI84921.1 Dipeptide transport system permease protein dppB [uncultured Clostridium sp.]
MGKKVLMSVVTVLISLVVVFGVIQSMPGDPVDILAQEIVKSENLPYDLAYSRAIATLNYDPNMPMAERFVSYVKGISTGDLGDSMTYKKPVMDIVKGALPWTLLVLSVSLTLSFAVGIILGIYIAWKRKKGLNTALTVYQSIFGSIPDYIVAYLLVFIFAVTLGILPSKGAYSSSVTPGFNLPFILNVIKHAVLPVLAYFVTTVATWTIAMKANAIGVLGEDYITYANVRGLSDRRVLIHYLGRNAMLPMITSLAVTFGLMFGGSPLIENLFLYPGVGYYLNMAIARRDFPLMQGMFLIIIIMVVLSSLLAELLYKVFNPRLRER